VIRVAGFVPGVARGLLGYAVAVALLATLAPFDFDYVPGRGMHVLFLLDDVLRNLLLLFPAGFLCALSGEPRLGSGTLRVLGLGLALGLAVELAQLLLPGRHSNLVDVLANGAGAWAGALAAQQLDHRLQRLLSEELLLELPVTGSLYLLASLLIVHTFAGGGTRVVSTALLGLSAAPVAAALYRERLQRTTALPVWRFVVHAGLVFAAAALPGMLRRPLLFRGAALLFTLAALGFALATWFALGLDRANPAEQRRFEARTAARTLPWFLLYVAGLAPRWRKTGAGVAMAGNRAALVLVETCAALTLLGYLLAELTSRARFAARWRVLGALLVGVTIGAAFEQDGWSSARLGVLLRPLLLGASCVAGVALHDAQVRLVQALRARRTQASATVMQSASNPP
jgi:VanZ family protein